MALSIADITNGLRRLQSLNKDLNDMDFREEILSLRSLLVEAQETIMELNQQLKSESMRAEKLKDNLADKARLVEYRTFFFNVGENGDPVGPPYCPICLRRDGTQSLTYRDGLYQVCPDPACRARIRNAPEFVWE